jgi:heme exporter protein A
MLEADHLAGHRGSTALFENLTFGVDAGHVLVVSGPNGAGKTTLLRIVAGLTALSAGTLRLRGKPVQPFDPLLRANVLFAGHAIALKDELTAEENVHALVRLAGAAVSREAVGRVLDDLGLGGQRALSARVLSAGQRRRVSLARLRLVERPLWVLDEPLTALDTSAAAAITRSIRSHLEAGGAALVATHQPLDLAPGQARTLVLGNAH